MGNRNSVIARNSIFLAIRMFFVLVVSLFTTRFLLKSLGVIDYGVYNAVCGFVSLFAFLNTSMTNGIQRFYNYSLGREADFFISDVFYTSIIIQLLISVVLIILTETIGLWYINHRMVIPPERLEVAKWVFQFSILSFLFVIFQAPFSALIMAYEHMDYYALVSVVDATLKLIISLLLSFSACDRLLLYGALILGDSIICFFLYFSYSRYKFPAIRLPRYKKDRTLFSSMLSFSGWNLFGSFSGVMKDQGINLVLNYFIGPAINAAKGVASQVNGALQGLVANLTIAVRPQVIQSYAAGDISRTMRLTYSVSKISCCALYFVSWPIILEIDYILDLWLEIVPSHTSSFVVLVLLISFVNCLNSAISGVIHASGKMMAYQVVSSIISILCIPSACIALKMGAQPESAFVWTFVFTTLSHIAGLLILKSIIDYSVWDYIMKILFPFLLLFVFTFSIPLIPHYLMPEGLFRLIIVIVVSVASIAPAFYFISLDKEEKQMMYSFVKSFLKRG